MAFETRYELAYDDVCVCLYVCAVHPLTYYTYIENRIAQLHHFCACCLCLWLSPFLGVHIKHASAHIGADVYAGRCVFSSQSYMLWKSTTDRQGIETEHL